MTDFPEALVDSFLHPLRAEDQLADKPPENFAHRDRPDASLFLFQRENGCARNPRGSIRGCFARRQKSAHLRHGNENGLSILFRGIDICIDQMLGSEARGPCRGALGEGADSLEDVSVVENRGRGGRECLARAIGFPYTAENRHLGGFLRMLAPELFHSVVVQVAKPCRSKVFNRFRKLSFLGQLQNFPFNITSQGSRFLGRVPGDLSRLDGSINGVFWSESRAEEPGLGGHDEWWFS